MIFIPVNFFQNLIVVVLIVSQYPELKKLQSEHKVLYLLFQIFFSTEGITQFSDQVRMRLISQLIKGISRVLQKLLKYFNDTAILTISVFPSAVVFLLF